MGRKLYPPYIDGKIPAFCGATLRVPFRHNRAVSSLQYSKMSCKVKTVSTNEWKWTLESDFIGQDPTDGNWYVDFKLDIENPLTPGKTYAEILIVGLYYKIQLAYVDTDGVVGYFSDVGVVKYTAKPTVRIENLTAGTNNSRYNYVGVYKQVKLENSNILPDVSEKEYMYNFTMIDEAGNVFITSGDQLHNSSTDIYPDESKDTFYCNKELDSNKKYRLKYTVTTINGLIQSSDTYYIVKKDSVQPSIHATLKAVPNYDNGYIQVYLEANDDITANGSFVICRSSSIDNFTTWNQICHFTLKQETPIKNLFNDFTIEQGIRYCYSLQQYNSRGIYSSRMLSNTVMADFEDMYLYDGERQLKIRFNPNVSSFKNDLLESKVDTIGSRYPFIFRNGNVKYKEFPITGLISYLMDDQAFFLNKDKLGPLEMETTDLISDNVRAERIFKLEVMEWLNNGKPKLFKSPTEGNYLVRLMNVSLQPNAVTGRMLHTFSSTAYEIGDTSYQTLEEYNLFTVKDFDGEVTMHFQTINLADAKYSTPLLTSNSIPTRIELDQAIRQHADSKIDIPYIYLGEFANVAPGSIIALQYKDMDIHNRNWTFITIGGTEVYEINTKDNPVIGLYLMWTPSSTKKFDGLFTFGYYSEVTTDAFSLIYDYHSRDVLGQFIGKHNDIINLDGVIKVNAGSNRSYNDLTNDGLNHIIKGLNTIKDKVGRCYWMRFSVREIKDFFPKIIDNNNISFCYDAGLHSTYNQQEIIGISVYADKSKDPVRYYDGRDLVKHSLGTWNGTSTYYIDTTVYDNPKYYWTEETLEPWTEDEEYGVDRLYKFSINHSDRNIDLKTIGRYIITDMENVTSISIGRMLVLDIYYNYNEIEYTIENELRDEALNAQNSWKNYKNEFFGPDYWGNDEQLGNIDRAPFTTEIEQLDTVYETYLGYVNAEIENKIVSNPWDSSYNSIYQQTQETVGN